MIVANRVVISATSFVGMTGAAAPRSLASAVSPLRVKANLMGWRFAVERKSIIAPILRSRPSAANGNLPTLPRSCICRLPFVRGNKRNKWPAQIVEMELKFFVFYFNEFTAFGRSQFLDSAGCYDDACDAHRFVYCNFHELPVKQSMCPISSRKVWTLNKKFLSIIAVCSFYAFPLAVGSIRRTEHKMLIICQNF